MLTRWEAPQTRHSTHTRWQRGVGAAYTLQEGLSKCPRCRTGGVGQPYHGHTLGSASKALPLHVVHHGVTRCNHLRARDSKLPTMQSKCMHRQKYSGALHAMYACTYV